MSSTPLKILGCLVVCLLAGCASVESATISHISQEDGTKKTEILLVLEGEVDKEEIGAFLEAASTAVAEGETLVFINPTLTATPGPATTATIATPTRTPQSGLSETNRAALWILLRNARFGSLEVYADPAFDVPAFGLTAIVDGKSFCNPDDIYGDEGALKLSCASSNFDHTTIENVSARTENQAFRCVRNNNSDAERSVFACERR